MIFIIFKSSEENLKKGSLPKIKNGKEINKKVNLQKKLQPVTKKSPESSQKQQVKFSKSHQITHDKSPSPYDHKHSKSSNLHKKQHDNVPTSQNRKARSLKKKKLDKQGIQFKIIKADMNTVTKRADYLCKITLCNETLSTKVHTYIPYIITIAELSHVKNNLLGRNYIFQLRTNEKKQRKQQ